MNTAEVTITKKEYDKVIHINVDGVCVISEVKFDDKNTLTIRHGQVWEIYPLDVKGTNYTVVIKPNTGDLYTLDLFFFPSDKRMVVTL